MKPLFQVNHLVLFRHDFFYFRGRSMIVPWSALDTITPEILRDFHQRLYTPGSNFLYLPNDSERIVIAASGTKHSHVVELVQKYFNMPANAYSIPKVTVIHFICNILTSLRPFILEATLRLQKNKKTNP